MRSKLPWLYLLLLLALLGCSERDTSWEDVQASGQLRVGLDPTFPPFENWEGEDVVGIDVDLARELAAAHGLEVTFVYHGYDGLYDALLTGQVDVLLSALVIDLTRTRDFAYSEPYFNAGQVLISEPNGPTSMEDLAGRRLAVEVGSEGHVQALTWERRLVGLEIMPLPAPVEALTAVASGEADAALADHVSARLFLREQPDLLISPEPVTVEPYALVTRAEDAALLEALDTTLAELESNGRLEAILAHWLD